MIPTRSRAATLGTNNVQNSRTFSDGQATGRLPHRLMSNAVVHLPQTAAPQAAPPPLLLVRSGCAPELPACPDQRRGTMAQAMAEQVQQEQQYEVDVGNGGRQALVALLVRAGWPGCPKCATGCH